MGKKRKTIVLKKNNNQYAGMLDRRQNEGGLKWFVSRGCKWTLMCVDKYVHALCVYLCIWFFTFHGICRLLVLHLLYLLSASVHLATLVTCPSKRVFLVTMSGVRKEVRYSIQTYIYVRTWWTFAITAVLPSLPWKNTERKLTEQLLTNGVLWY